MGIRIGAGTGEIRVVLDAAAGAADRFAARELAAALGQMCGRRVGTGVRAAPAGGVSLLLGAAADRAAGPEARPLAEDEVDVAQVGPAALALRGGGPRGPLYAVCEVLEALGVRWYHPEVTVIPRRSVMTLPGRLHARPAFEYREAYWAPLSDDKRFAARLRINGSIIGVPPAMGGHWGWEPYVHTFFKIVPPARHAGRHPDYYSFRRGQGRVVQGGQLCLSHPDVLDLLTAFALEKMADPDVRIVDISQMDCANPCECPACAAKDRRAGSHAGSLLAACNEVAARTSRVHPGKFIGTLAYTYTLVPPRGVLAHPNVIVRLCHMNNECQTHPLDGCAANRAFLDVLRAWCGVAQRVYIWDYVTNFQHLLSLHPNFHSLRADLRLLRDAGARGVFLQGYPQRGTSFAALHAYAMGRCLWDSGRDYFDEARAFLAAYYGDGAAPCLWRMIEALHRPPAGGFHLSLYRHPHQGTFAAAGLATAERHLQRARAASGGGAAPRRLGEVALWMDFTRMAAAPAVAYAPGLLRIRAAGADAAARYGRVRRETRARGIRRICEFPQSMNDLAVAWGWSVRDRDLPLAVLENERVRVEISPELNGAVCALLDKRTGIDLLCKPDPRILAYPYMTGIIEGVIAEEGGALGFRAFDRWRVAAVGSGRLAMRLGLGRGLWLEREITLLGDAPGIRVRSVLCNRSAKPQRVAPHGFALYRAGRLDDVRFYKRDAGGAARDLRNGMRAGANQEQWVNLSGREAPRREWGFFNAELGLGLSESFNRAIAFCGSNGHLDTQHILTEMKARPVLLPPGGRLAWDRTFRLLHQAPGHAAGGRSGRGGVPQASRKGHPGP